MRYVKMLIGWLLIGCAVYGSPKAEVIKNKKALEAKRAYETVLKQARARYVIQLSESIKEEGAKGNLKQANLLNEMKNKLEAGEDGSEVSAIMRAQKKLEGTRWGPTVKNSILLLTNRRVLFGNKTSGVWILTGTRTLVLQSSSSVNITVWSFNDRLNSATVHTFKHARGSRVYNRQR